MATHTAPCGLCQQVRELRNSHLFPAAVYKSLRTLANKADPNPVVVTKSKSFTSSKQISSLFLCDSCEQRFSANGESYVLPQCAQPNGQFKLRELLQSASPLHNASDIKVYDVWPLLGSKIDQYLYFAASIFWRATARHWKIGNEYVSRIILGSQYQEQFRLYLLGKASFPQNGRLMVFASSEIQPNLMTTIFPTKRVDGAHRHRFHILGLFFVLYLGGDAPRQFDKGALNGNYHKLIFLCSERQNDALVLGALNLISRSKPSKKLASKAKGMSDNTSIL